jgi:hypothetical protein
MLGTHRILYSFRNLVHVVNLFYSIVWTSMSILDSRFPEEIIPNCLLVPEQVSKDVKLVTDIFDLFEKVACTANGLIWAVETLVLSGSPVGVAVCF